MKREILDRMGYSARIEQMFGRGIIIALTGQRRVGKSVCGVDGQNVWTDQCKRNQACSST